MTGDLPPSFERTAAAGLLRRLKQVLGLTDTVVWEVDLEALTTDYFGPVEAVTGLPVSELDDPLTVASKTIHPDDQRRVAEAYEGLLDGETEAVDLEYRTHPKNGPVRWHRTQAVLEGEHDSLTIVGISTDITRLKEQEARLKEFASVVSHDLRNPLNVAQANVTMAQEETDSEELAAATDALERMEALIEDLLFLAREGADLGEQDPINLGRLAETCWANVETGEATLAVETDATIRADRSRLQQLLENLFRNSVEHGGEDVTVTVGSLDDGFYVADDGVGLPETQRESLFQPGGTDSETGLGLMIVAQVADAHDWDARATESAAGGARFEFTGVEQVT